MKTAGIVGGLGPEITAQLYTSLIEEARKRGHETYPHIIIDSIPLLFRLDSEQIGRGKNEQIMLELLTNSIKILEKAGVDFIAIPCNTVHCFISELQEQTKVPILNIIDETIDVAIKNGVKTLGILATTETRKTNLYEDSAKHKGIGVVAPTESEQSEIEHIIYKILNQTHTAEGSKFLYRVAENLVERGADAVALACTDLPLIYDLSLSPVPVIDSVIALRDAILRELGEDY
ncbi:MAG: hypothetical protein A2666_05515 [Parcubacteria group bacterium RIFCSPHIGHO2_01_FULL_47_10b]|nr:MAG: hypothetical protein A2666_05515 [Parcubacteria group bacterium RIFCSPHIGHO2_01_FULL_47_10b]